MAIVPIDEGIPAAHALMYDLNRFRFPREQDSSSAFHGTNLPCHFPSSKPPSYCQIVKNADFADTKNCWKCSTGLPPFRHKIVNDVPYPTTSCKSPDSLPCGAHGTRRGPEDSSHLTVKVIRILPVEFWPQIPIISWPAGGSPIPGYQPSYVGSTDDVTRFSQAGDLGQDKTLSIVPLASFIPSDGYSFLASNEDSRATEPHPELRCPPLEDWIR